MVVQRAKIAESHGKGFRILTGTITSPTLARQLDALLRTYPEARWSSWEPISRSNVSNGALLAYGQPVESVPKLTQNGGGDAARVDSLTPHSTIGDCLGPVYAASMNL